MPELLCPAGCEYGHVCGVHGPQYLGKLKLTFFYSGCAFFNQIPLQNCSSIEFQLTKFMHAYTTQLISMDLFTVGFLFHV